MKDSILLMRILIVLFALTVVACTAERTPAPVVSVPAENPPLQAHNKMPEPATTPAEDTAPEAQSLLGKSPAAIQAMIGAPSLVRRDDSVQTMLFEITTCVLEIVYREPATAAHFQAEHIAARNTRGHDLDATECLAAVYTAHKQ